MHRSEAIAYLMKLVEVNDDAIAREALAVVLATTATLPPTALARATNEAQALAHQFTKTGVSADWQTPPHHSKALEHLVWRVTSFLEALLPLLQEAQNMDDNEVTS